MPAEALNTDRSRALDANACNESCLIAVFSVEHQRDVEGRSGALLLTRDQYRLVDDWRFRRETPANHGD